MALKRDHKRTAELSIVKLVALGVAVISIMVSIYYSTLWGLYIGQPWFISLPSSLAYIVFTNMLFEVSVGMLIKTKSALILVYRMDKKDKAMASFLMVTRLLAGIFVMVAWSMVVLYSMASTVGGQYDQIVLAERGREESTYVENTSVILESLEYRKNMLEESLLVDNNEIETLVSRLGKVETVEDAWEYKGTMERDQKRLDKLRVKTMETKNSIFKLVQEIADATKDKSSFSVDSGSAFSYFSRIFGFTELEIQFFMSLFPSLFIDIISPIALAIALYKKD